MNLPFFAADTLGVTLHAVKTGLKASEVHQIELGPWRLDLSIDVDSDLMSGSEVSLWVTLAKSLQLYLIIREKESWLLVLDPAQLERIHAYNGIQSAKVSTRVLELKPAIRGVFLWRGAGWSRVQYDSAAMGGG